MSRAPLDTLLEFLRFPSISTDSAYREDTRKAADWLAAFAEGRRALAVKFAQRKATQWCWQRTTTGRAAPPC